MTRRLGFSLFEVLLVLILASVIAAGAFEFYQEKRDNEVADVLAQRMYFFSQAVRSFATDNQNAIINGTFVCPPVPPDSSCLKHHPSGEHPKYVFTGVTWLTNPVSGDAYLDSDFTFDNLGPLELQRSADDESLIDDAAIKVIIEPIVVAGGKVTDIIIDFGSLYDVQDVTKPEPKGAISAKAATKAANMYDPMLGPSAFTYTAGLDAEGNQIPIQATLGPLSDSTAGFLRLDGTSIMSGDINFQSDASKSIDFGAKGGKIENVNQIDFVSTGVFEGVTILDTLGSGELEKAEYAPDKYFCALSQVFVETIPGKCSIGVNDAGHYKLEKQGSGTTCKVRCFRFAPP